MHAPAVHAETAVPFNKYRPAVSCGFSGNRTAVQSDGWPIRSRKAPRMEYEAIFIDNGAVSGRVGYGKNRGFCNVENGILTF